jgi:hypothetical protein
MLLVLGGQASERMHRTLSLLWTATSHGRDWGAIRVVVSQSDDVVQHVERVAFTHRDASRQAPREET